MEMPGPFHYTVSVDGSLADLEYFPLIKVSGSQVLNVTTIHLVEAVQKLSVHGFIHIKQVVRTIVIKWLVQIKTE